MLPVIEHQHEPSGAALGFAAEHRFDKAIGIDREHSGNDGCGAKPPDSDLVFGVNRLLLDPGDPCIAASLIKSGGYFRNGGVIFEEDEI